MNKKILVIVASVSALIWSGRPVWAQSAYFRAITNLNPAVYFPLEETAQPPTADVETNYGSLGRVADAVYSSQNAVKGQAGATADGDTSVLMNDQQGSFLAVPTTDGRTGFTNVTAFTVECWVNSAEQDRNFEGIVAKSGGNNAGINGNNNQAGWCLSQNYIALLDSANLRGFDFHVYNGIGHGGAEVIVPFNVVNGTWYHLVATFDGTNCVLYVNGTNEVTAGNAIQIPMTGTYVPDTWNPLQIGSSRNLNGNNYHGNIDEVAIYTNVLSSAQVQAHYNAARNSAPYSSTILADNPYMYWRMDSPGYTAPDPSTTYPVATNYGWASDWFGLYGTATQPGVPGPQFPGMLDPNNGNTSYACAINGIGGNNGGNANVPLGFDGSGHTYSAPDAAPVILETTGGFTDPQFNVLNPTNGPGNRQPFSVTIWFQARPTDYSRFQTIFGHSDDGWRLAMNTGNSLEARWNPGPGGEFDNHIFSQNDGAWHQFVGTYDGTNVLTYMDSVLVTNGVLSANGLGSPTWPMLGGAPDYLNAGNDYTYGIATGNRSRTGYGQRLFSGNIAQFAFFTNVLTAAQIQALYNTAVPNRAPILYQQPITGRVNPAPASLSFSVVANGTAPLSYQWYHNSVSNYVGATMLVDDGVKYVGSTNSQVTISNLVASDSGYYFCVITNNYGSVTSILASLQVNFAPAITAQNPATNFSIFQGQGASLSVTANSTTNLTYQWYVNGVADPAGTNAVYVSPPVTSPGTSFYCIVSTPYGSATSLTVAATSILPIPAAVTNSMFGSNVLALRPTAYWPMHETEAAASGPTETNYGTLGALGNGYDENWKNIILANYGYPIGGNENAPYEVSIMHGVAGAIAGDPNPAMNFMGANNSFIVVPRRPDSNAQTLKPPMTIEAWVRPFSHSGWGAIIAQDGGTANAAGNRAGFELIYSGTPDTFSMPIWSGNGGQISEPKTAAIYPPGQWYHVVATYDGTNVQIYVNGVPDSMTGVNGTNGTYAVMAPNTWDPITIGCAQGLGANLWKGTMDEIAVYTNILSLTEIQKHYADGTNAAYHNYQADVLADNPVLYYRMDSPAWTPPDVSTWPVLNNYGAVAVNGVYTPNSAPGSVPGPAVNGVPIAGTMANNALLQDGFSMFADAGNIPQFHPSGKTPFTVAAWMRGNPTDINTRNWQAIVANGDSSWRLNMNGGNGRANFNSQNSGDVGNSTTSGYSLNINDGNWHYVVGTCDGSNTLVWVDGLLSASNFNANLNNSSQNIDVFLGGYPQNNNMNWYTNVATAVANEVSRVLGGEMCEAAFWYGKALTPSQITALYNAAGVGPSFIRQPVTASVDGNAPFTNTVLAVGSAPLSYQWYQNNTPRAGQTNASLFISAAKPSDNGNYYVVVSNPYLVVTSAVVTLTVNTNISIVQDVAVTNYTLFAGGHAGPFSVLASGTRPFGYVWYANGVPIPGATNSSYFLTNVQPPNSTNTYFCVATNAFNSATSSVVTVTVLSNPTAPYTTNIMADNPVGFWRLNEPDQGGGNNGLPAHDYAGGNNGLYTNTILGNPPYNPNDTNAASAEFGFLGSIGPLGVAGDNDVYGIPTSVDFSAPVGSNSDFSVEAWVRSPGPLQGESVDAGIVSKGYGGGGEQFDLDTGSNADTNNPHSFRFFVRDASGTVHGVNSSVNPNDGAWHYLVGVCDESHGQVIFYIDGLPVGTNSITPGSGILASSLSMLIGSRPSAAGTNNNFQFVGYIEDVAVYHYALSATQVANHLNVADIPAGIIRQPADTIASQNGTATFSAFVAGTAPTAYWWYDVGTGLVISNGTILTGSANLTLYVPNVQNNDSYYLVVSNAFNNGTPVQSTTANLTVVSGPPQIYADLQSQYFVQQGARVQLPVTVYGTLPIAYQWQMSDTNGVNWTNLTDNVRITGSQSNVLTIANAQLSDAGDYRLVAVNGSGQVTSATANLVVGKLPLNFNVNGIGWQTNGSSWITSSNVLTLTDPSGRGGNGSFFFNYPQYIGAFKASFTYQDVDQGGADGFTFCVQNDVRGPGALGGGGGSLGVSGITPSLEVEVNLYNGNSQIPGYDIKTNGLTGASGANGNYLSLTNYGINFNNGDPYDFTVAYAQGWLSLTITDRVAGVSFNTMRFVGDLTRNLGSQTAYVGFTGAYGGVQSHQIITNFTFVSIPTAAIQLNGTNVSVSWPGVIPGYGLQRSTDLAAGNWVNVTNAPVLTNELFQITVPVGSSNAFYRLNLQ